MVTNFHTMLCLFGAASTGNNIQIQPDINVDAVISCAAKQGVWQLVYAVIQSLPEAQKFRLQFLTSVSEALRRNEFTLEVIDKIQKSGIDICLLKGVFASSMYANSDCRISGDTDVLISENDEKKVIEILKKAGYTIGEREKNDHHLKCKHPIGGLIEVHVSLYGEITDKIIFCGKLVYDEEYMEFEYGNRKIKTLGINDNLKYLTAHYIKHFLTGGSSIRQMMDLLLYMKHYQKYIDFDKYYELMKELKYDKLIEAVKTIGAKYFGMDFDISEEKLADDILNDCEAVGLFGSVKEKKSNVYEYFCSSRQNVSGIKLKLLFAFKSETTIFSRFFPSKRVLMKKGYKYAQNSFLIPIAWIHNLYNYILKKDIYKKEKYVDDELTISRKTLMKKLDMID